MKIYDCFIYNNEELILDLRLNFLNKFVDKFIIVESKETHQGKEKKNFFDIKRFKKYENKIKYIFIESFPKNLSNWGRENFQRNYISEGLKDINDDDLVMISDVDEIPNIKKLKFSENFKYTVFEQKNYCYKFNLLNKTYPIWNGTKLCKKKYLKSPQWLRNQKVKKYSFFRFFKIKWNVVKDGGWHFSYIMDPSEIKNKIESFGHGELNEKKFTDLKNIEYKINQGKDLFNRDQFYEKKILDNTFPLILINENKKYQKWILS